ncbi:MAG TPA: alpha/beta hydrolase, partial [Acidimicrobiia bacterium]|nr:alpha/beta hydrolase [Acidimicrobiia bacterium]
MTAQEVRYARSGEVDVAWTITGDGPVDIVYVAGFISHLDLARELPVGGALLGRLDRIGRVLAFDKRGTGLSGRDLGFGSFAERIDDIRAVMDAAGWECAHLFAVSEGGPLSLLFAATYPDRVLSLSVYGSFACLLDDDDRFGPTTQAGFDRLLADVERDWGDGTVLAPLVHAPDDPAVYEQLGRYERACATPRRAAQILRRNTEIDVRSSLASISAPTLVVHRTNDPVLPVAHGRAIADGIQRATFVELPGDMHCGWDAREWAPVLDELEEFLTGSPRAVAD